MFLMFIFMSLYKREMTRLQVLLNLTVGNLDYRFIPDVIQSSVDIITYEYFDRIRARQFFSIYCILNYIGSFSGPNFVVQDEFGQKWVDIRSS